MKKSTKIILPGAAGLVGQNLIVLLKQKGYQNIVAIDKHPKNVAILKSLHPDITVIENDLAVDNSWQDAVTEGSVVVMLQAQIGAKDATPFYRNNIESTRRVLEVAEKNKIEYLVHISSSVVESVGEDDYTKTKKDQEAMVAKTSLAHCILRPTLMFGWFDRKHLGWLSRFMQKAPLFPIPGSGRYMRQPLYVLDFCHIIIACLEQQPDRKVYNITGKEQIDYIDIIRQIKKAVHAKTLIVRIPYALFWVLLTVYALFDKDPPFTTSQLKALTAGDEFELIPWWDIFGVKPTPLQTALYDTFNDPTYSKVILDF